MSLLSCFQWKQRQRHAVRRRGNLQKPSSLRQQNYHTLLERCLKEGCLFEDEFFPAEDRSIGTGPLIQKLTQKIEWKRPHELHKNPVFYSATTKRLALCQGPIPSLGILDVTVQCLPTIREEDCWFLAALEALTFQQDILFNVVPQNQTFDKRKYAGIFHFKFWHFGEWVDVVIDDRLPVNEAGQLLFLSSVYKNLFWGALLEKAYAKLCGSYEDLQIGQVSEALVDFTGGVNITIKLAEAPPDLWDILIRATYSRALIGCQTHSGPRRVLPNGLVVGHAYTLTGIRKVTCKHGTENLVRLRNPWGKVEWKGDWSDSSGKWELLSPKEKILLRRNRDDGEFWMSVKDFKAHFVDLMICKLTPDLMSQENGKKWMCSMQFGRWVKGSTAGGRVRLYKDSFWTNPQYQLKVLQGNASKRSMYSCNVLVCLMQKHNSKHRNRMPHLHIGLSIFKVGSEVNTRWRHNSIDANSVDAYSHRSDGTVFWIVPLGCNPKDIFLGYQESNQKLPPEFFVWNRPLVRPVFVNDREVTQNLRLPPGVYVIIPSTSEPHQESEFILRVFSRKHNLHELGEESSSVLSKEIIDKYEGQAWDDFFSKYFDLHPEINTVQLQMILNNVTWTNLQNHGLRFSLDTCRSILALLDLNSTGTLNIQEFRFLWKKLLLYEEVFQKKDIHHAGTLDLAELQAAMQEVGVSLSNELCKLLAIRYGTPSLQINFENFVCFMLRVELMGVAFHNTSKDGKGIYLQESEWMMMTLYS